MNSSPYDPLGPGHYVPHENEIAHKYPEKRVGVFFATREGHTRHVAERMMMELQKAEFDADLHDVRHLLLFDFKHYGAAVLAASVHQGHHEREMVQFVRTHRSKLQRLPTVFISVTLSQAGVERPEAFAVAQSEAIADVDKMVGRFFEETQWFPTYVKPVAGALLYSKYNFFVRFIMKQIAKKAGAATDTSSDYDYTNWKDLDRFA